MVRTTRQMPLLMQQTVPAREQLSLKRCLRIQALILSGMPRRLEQLFGARDAVWRPVNDLFRERESFSKGSSASRVTTPIRCASSAKNTLPVIVSSLAISIRTRSRSVTVSDMSGIKPHLPPAYGKLAVWGRDAHVRAKGNLKPTSKTYAVQRCNNGNF